MVAATSPTGRHFKPENYENYKLCRKAFATCCSDMNTLLCVYGSTTLKKGDSCPFSLDAFTDKNTAQLDHFWTSEMEGDQRKEVSLGLGLTGTNRKGVLSRRTFCKGITP